jgi:hypothetical protein
MLVSCVRCSICRTRSFVAINKPTDGKHFLRALGKVYTQSHTHCTYKSTKECTRRVGLTQQHLAGEAGACRASDVHQASPVREMDKGNYLSEWRRYSLHVAGLHEAWHFHLVLVLVLDLDV